MYNFKSSTLVTVLLNLYRNIPNVLSGYRILAIPVIVYALATGDHTLFIVLISVSLLTDILDGLIARMFDLESELGARLDSIADIGTYLMAVSGMWILEKDFVTDKKYEFSLLIILWLLPQLVSFVRHFRFPSFHLYSNKITGYFQGIFIFTYFLFGYNSLLFYSMLVISCIAYLEELYFVLKLSQLQSNLKSIFHFHRPHKNNP